MTALSSSPIPSGSPAAPPRGRRRFCWVCLTGLVLLGALGWYGWRQATTPAPPPLPLAGSDPVVVEVVEKAVAKVHAEPRSGKAWGGLGMVLRAHGIDPEANTCFTQAERFDPRDPRWPYLHGVGLVPSQPEAALPYLERALKLCLQVDPERAEAVRLRLAETLLELGRHEEAEAQLRSVVEDDEGDLRAHFSLGLVAYARGDLARARGHLVRAVASPFAREKAAAVLAVLCRRLGDDKAADEYIAVSRQPRGDLPWPDPFLGECLALQVGHQGRLMQAQAAEREGRLAQSVRLLEGIVRDSPDAHSLVTLGVGLGKGGEYDRAEEVFRAALRLAPEMLQAHYFRSVSLYSHGEALLAAGDRAAGEKYRAARDAARRALALKPNYGLAYLCLGLSLRRLGERKEAIATLRAAVRYRPDLSDPHFELGQALAEDGRPLEAAVHLQDARRLAPDDPRPQQALAQARDAFKIQRRASQ